MAATQPTTTNVLIDVISNLLVPMFLVASNDDVALAQLAAIQTINAYRVQNQADLVTVAQILSFSLAALGSLSLSMDDGLSLSMILRLRGNANACSRSTERHRRALRASHQEVSDAPVDAVEPDESRFAAQSPTAPSPAAHSFATQPFAAQSPVQSSAAQPSAAQPSAAQPSAAQPPSAAHAKPSTPPAATPAPAQPQPGAPVMPMTADGQRRALWAAAFNEVAAEYTAEIPHLPPAEQKAASIRAAALSSSATALLSGVDLAPYRLGPITPPKGVKPR